MEALSLIDSYRFADYVEQYDASAKMNDYLWSRFAGMTDAIPCLRTHRDWVEKHQWGFGDRAFHYMWYLLLKEEVLSQSEPRLLEIGVFRGQVLSLWALLCRQHDKTANIFGISPFSGSPTKRLGRWMHRVRYVLDAAYREDAKSANFYPEGDYLADVRSIFDHFGLDHSSLTLIRGRSQDAMVQKQVAGIDFDLVYVDGGHRYEEAKADIGFYGHRVKIGGYLVVDDASYFQKGTKFWKGVESVSRAADEIDAKRFVNVLNIGHNRIYKRRA